MGESRERIRNQQKMIAAGILNCSYKPHLSCVEEKQTLLFIEDEGAKNQAASQTH